MSDENINNVQRLFEAVGKGDMLSVRDMLAKDIEWRSPVTRSDHKGLTWCRPRHGPEDVLGFFRGLSEKGVVEPFEDLTYFAQGIRSLSRGETEVCRGQPEGDTSTSGS